MSNQTPKEREQKTSAEPTEAKTEKKPYDPEEFEWRKSILDEVLFSAKIEEKPSKPDRAKMKKFPSIEVELIYQSILNKWTLLMTALRARWRIKP